MDVGDIVREVESFQIVLNEENTIHQVKRYRDKRYRAKQRYRADFFRFFWLDNVSPGVIELCKNLYY